MSAAPSDAAAAERKGWLARSVLCWGYSDEPPTSEAGDTPSESLELLYGHLREAPNQQIQQGMALDDKAQRAMLVGATVLGLSAVTTIGGAGWWVAAPILGALVAFVGLAVVALVNARPAKYGVTTDADATWPHYRTYERADILEGILDSTAEAYTANDRINRQKACRLRVISTLLVAELVLVAAAIVAAALAA